MIIFITSWVHLPLVQLLTRSSSGTGAILSTSTLRDEGTTTTSSTSTATNSTTCIISKNNNERATQITTWFQRFVARPSKYGWRNDDGARAFLEDDARYYENETKSSAASTMKAKAKQEDGTWECHECDKTKPPERSRCRDV